jgi:hypothetical protein
MIFLIHYDRRGGVIKLFTPFADSRRSEAESLRARLEIAESSVDTHSEIVLLEAESEADLRRTHRRYFSTASDLLKTAAEEATTSSTKAS